MSTIISVIIPVFNTEMFLEECINSIVSQTYHDLEILLIDDGSAKRCADLCDRFADEDARIRVIHQNNTGVSSARNKGLAECTGEWVLFADSDDVLDLNCCEQALFFCKANDLDSVIFRYKRISANGITDHTRHQKTSFSMKTRILTPDEVMLSLLDNRIGNFCWNRLCKKELFKDVSFPEGHLYEDIGTVWKVMANSSRTGFLNECLYSYRQVEGSISHVNTASSIRDDFIMREELWNHITRTCPEIKQGQECFILAPALKYCIYTEEEEDSATYNRALLLIQKNRSIPEIFSARQKIMMWLLLFSPKLFHLICHLSRKRHS